MDVVSNTSEQSKNEEPIPAPIASSPRDLVEDQIKLDQANRSGVLSFLSASVGEQVQILRDLLNISITTILGALTAFVLQDRIDIIKSDGVFYLSLFFLFISVVLNVISRLQIIDHLRATTLSIESSYIDKVVLVKEYLLIPSSVNLEKMMSYSSPSLNNPRWLARNGHRLVSSLFVSGLIGLAASLLFHISV